MLSKKTRYALKALMILTESEDQNKGPVLISELAKRGNIPKKFLESILLELKNAGILDSRKGRGGGYKLFKDPDQVSIGRVMCALDGPLVFLPCFAHAPGKKCGECDEADMQVLRVLFKEVQESMSKILDRTSLEKVYQIQRKIDSHKNEMYFI
jgi:Rrf2 family protein